MSQAKVDRYKEAKKNRKETIAKEKRQQALARVIGSALVVALVAWIGVSGYNMYEAKKPLETVYVDTTALDDYMTTLDTE